MAEWLFAVIVAEQEGETGQLGAQLDQVVAVGAHVAAEGGGELRLVGAGEPLADEGEHLGELGRVDQFGAALPG
ncbi:MAG: hypothetical protein J2P57_16550 [Acidimicrobiaceae bacterium]|nr:hypothetical protein [Acidimicrobiaceae bacterium]